jgi:hypothetical protein
MLPILLVVAAIAATAIAIPCAASTRSPSGKDWLPWALLVLGVASLAIAIFERAPKVDFKASAKANAMVLLFGPVGARVAYALVGGAFAGGGIGLLVA